MSSLRAGRLAAVMCAAATPREVVQVFDDLGAALWAGRARIFTIEGLLMHEQDEQQQRAICDALAARWIPPE